MTLAGQLGPAVGGCLSEAVRGAARRGVAGGEVAEADPGRRRLTLRRRRLRPAAAARRDCQAGSWREPPARPPTVRSNRPSSRGASRSTSGSTVATGWSGSILGVPPRRAMLGSTPRAICWGVGASQVGWSWALQPGSASRPARYPGLGYRRAAGSAGTGTGSTRYTGACPAVRRAGSRTLLALQRPHVGGLRAPLALGDVELDGLPLVK
jgi:hypothetical protein